MNGQDLKNSILQMAMQGKLVEQRPEEGDSSEIINEIKQNRKLSVLPDAKPWDLPNSWDWVSLADVADFNCGYAFKSSEYKNKGTRVIRISDFDENGIIDKAPVYYDGKEDLQKYLLNDNDILLCMTGGTVGKNYFVENLREEMLVNQRVADIKIRYMNSKFVSYLIKTPSIQDIIHESKTSTNDNISLKTIKNFLVPVPPLSEQERIVLKLDYFMDLTSEYDLLEQERVNLDVELPEKLKKSILQYAMQGKLVPQIPSEGTAEELYAQIQEEKQKLTVERKINNKKALPDIEIDETPFDIPKSWKWVPFCNVVMLVGTNNNKILSKEVKNKGSIPVVSQGQSLIDGYTDNVDKSIKDVPVIMFGDHTRNVKYVDFEFVIGADGAKFFKPINIYCKYLYYWTIYISNKLRNRGYARHFGLLKKEYISLPPYKEQKRIVKKVDLLLKECDNIKKS